MKSVISPSIMCAPSWHETEILLNEFKENGVKLIHADVMDGHFVPNIMLGTASIRELRKISPIPLDLHFMVEQPENMLDWFYIQPMEYVSVHAESTKHLQKVLCYIKNLGAKPMVALNPATPLCMIEEVLPDLEGLLIMTVNPGFAGQKMVPQMLEKITKARKMLDKAGLTDVPIEVDGNVSFENAIKMRQAGANIFVCGTASLFSGAGTLQDNIAHMRACIE